MILIRQHFSFPTKHVFDRDRYAINMCSVVFLFQLRLKPQTKPTCVSENSSKLRYGFPGLMRKRFANMHPTISSCISGWRGKHLKNDVRYFCSMLRFTCYPICFGTLNGRQTCLNSARTSWCGVFSWMRIWSARHLVWHVMFLQSQLGQFKERCNAG